MRIKVITSIILILICASITMLRAQEDEKSIENSEIQKHEQSQGESGQTIDPAQSTVPDSNPDNNNAKELSTDEKKDVDKNTTPFTPQTESSDTEKPAIIPETDKQKTTSEQKVRDQSMTHELPSKKRVPLFDYHVAYGGFFPIGAYGNRYDPGHLATAGIGLYRYNLWGIAPEVIFRYTHLDSIKSNDHPDSYFNIFQVSAGLIYRYEFIMYPSARMMTVFARITEGVSIMQYHEKGYGDVEEYINTLGVSAGLSIAVWDEIRLGFEVGYRIIFTAGDYMQGFIVNATVGYRY